MHLSFLVEMEATILGSLKVGEKTIPGASGWWRELSRGVSRRWRLLQCGALGMCKELYQGYQIGREIYTGEYQVGV